MKRIIAAILLACLPMSPAGQPAPRLLSAQWGNLEGVWRFRTDPQEVGEREGWQRLNLEDTDWRDLRVPGYWEAQGVTDHRPGQPPRPRNGMAWTDYDGVAWYRLRFVIPTSWKGQELLLTLGSVDDEDRTYLNGRLIGATGAGVQQAVSIPRRYRVPASAVRYGQENTLAVRVKDGGGPGGLMGPFVSLLPKKVAETMGRVPDANRPLETQFTDPAAETRILKIIHSWPDGAEAQDTLIRQLIAQGFGGVVCNVSFNSYLTSVERWRDFERAVKKAKSAGMTLWLYDEKGYPSGAAGGLTLKDHPEMEARGLLIADKEQDGGPVELDVPPGRVVLVRAFPVRKGQIILNEAMDLSNGVKERRLAGALPPGRWRVMAVSEDRLYEGTHASLSLGDKLPYINLLEPAPTARFLKLTHDAYAERMGKDMGRWFDATFTDEPSLMSMFMRPMPWRVLPWGPSLPDVFRGRRGYDIVPLLPALVADVGPQGAKARYDFWQTVGEMVSENYFGQIRVWCRAHKIASGGHLLMEESLTAHVPLYGDFFRCARRLDAPSIDCLTSLPAEVPWTIARLIGSTADLERRTLTMCETSDFGQVYRPAGDKRPIRPVSEEEIRGTCNRLLLGGINTITSYYTFQDLTSEQLQRLNRWVGRCSTLLRGGHQVSDIAMLYPIESLWPRFTPARSGATDSPTAAQVESAYQTAADSLYTARRDFTFVDSRTLAEATVQDGVLSRGSLRWRVVVLPCADTLPLAAWENLARFHRSGGVVIALGALPANSESEFPSPRVKEIARLIFGQETGPSVQANGAHGAGIWLPPGTETLLPIALDGVLDTDVRVLDDLQAPLRVTHRRINGREVYFLINDGAQPWKGTVHLVTEGDGEQWDPATGKRTPLMSGNRVALDLPGYGGVLLRFKKARSPRRVNAVASGPLPGLERLPLTFSEPTIGAGEFVRTSLTSPDKGVWQTIGTLSKGNVDTFLFLLFRATQPLGLGDTDGLALDTATPEGQEAPTQLLVIVTERDGGQYLANTGRLLTLGGNRHIVIPWSRFQPFGERKDPNGRLDRDAITAIAVGWGGYLGREGERLEFSLSTPRAFRLPRPPAGP